MKSRIGINLIAQVVAFAINICISFFLTPYIVNIIGIEANGFVGLANNFIEYAQLLTVAINSMVGRFVTIKIHKNQIEEANKYFTSVLVVNIVIAIILSIIFGGVIAFLTNIINISPELVTDVKLLWGFIFFNFIISLFTSVYSVSTFAKNRLELAALCNIKAYLIRAGILIVSYVFFKPVVWYIGLALSAMGVYTLITHIRYTKKLMPELKFDKKNYDFSKIKELIKSGIWNSISKLSSILSSGLDLLITNLLVSPVAMGVVSLSKIIPTIILSFFGTIANIFAPQLTISYAKGEKDDMKSQLLFAIKLFGILASIPIAIIVGLGQEFYGLWTPTQDSHLLYLLTVVSCINLAFALPVEPLYNIFTVTNKIKASSIALILFSMLSITLVFVGLSFANTDMEKMFIIVGVGSFVNAIRVLTFLPIYGAKCMGYKKTTFYPPIFKNIGLIILLSIVAFGIKNLINVNSWIALIIVAIVVGAIGLIFNFMIICTKEEKQKILLMVKQRSFSK